MTVHYSEYRHWSPMLGGQASRLSMFDERGSEFFVIIPDEGGRAYRERKAAMLEMIYTAIQQGQQPGEVRVT